MRFYTRPVCPLCDEVVEALQPWLEHASIELEFVNIENNPELEEKWGCSIPVLEYQGRPFAKGRYDISEAMDRLKSRLLKHPHKHDSETT